jgi:hypothetical protein
MNVLEINIGSEIDIDIGIEIEIEIEIEIDIEIEKRKQSERSEKVGDRLKCEGFKRKILFIGNGHHRRDKS